MSFSWGNKIRLTIYGESHGLGVGIIIDGIKSGTKINYKLIDRDLRRRKPNKIKGTTQRREDDSYQVISGIFNDYTNGGPINIFFANKDSKSKDYTKFVDTPRPSHADYPALIKYNNFNDHRGGGFFSGRMTAPIVFAGSIARNILFDKQIEIYSRIAKVGQIVDKKLDILALNKKELNKLSNESEFMLDKKKNEEAIELISNLTDEGDSVGAKVDCFALNLPVGLGEPFFDSIESKLSSFLFSIPGIKAVEFGMGTEFSNHLGSQVNDEYEFLNNKVKTKTNYNGGILGGLSNGMPLFFSTTFKPTASIAKAQKSISLAEKKNVLLKIKGRHDSCIALRGRVVVEAALAIVLLDLIY